MLCRCELRARPKVTSLNPFKASFGKAGNAVDMAQNPATRGKRPTRGRSPTPKQKLHLAIRVSEWKTAQTLSTHGGKKSPTVAWNAAASFSPSLVTAGSSRAARRRQLASPPSTAGSSLGDPKAPPVDLREGHRTSSTAGPLAS